MIGIIDYNAGNIRSVQRALEELNLEYIMSKNPTDLASADKLIFPGDGDDSYAMQELAKSGYDTFIKEAVAKGTFILGICVGSQILFEFTEEGNSNCLGLLEGRIRHFSSVFADNEKKGLLEAKDYAHLKIPHMGWNNLRINKASLDGEAGCPILKGIDLHNDFYFVHSYLIQPKNDEIVAAWADYGVPVPACIHKDSIYACQFHPEKSGKPGLQILKNFAELEK
ncbi:MAG: imidazole glycerol phosphate synthase, glutamine amidotransferase subunit [Treponema sp. CETP13]|nr:MAG: imidazole glycerol phosphate synthase, glutamine amidotransferase subunit [Treponema sp. CETP13]